MVVVNTTERRVSISISRGPKGAPFTFEDFTPEQLDDLKLRFSDLTEADKDELKLKFSDLTPEEKEELSLKWEDLTPEQKLELKGEKGDAFTFEDFTAAQLASLKGEKGDPFTYEDFTQEQKDEVFNTFLSNFYDPSIVALSSRGSNEGATFEVKLNKIQDEMNILDPLPSLLMLPSGVKAGKLYSILPEDGSGDFTVNRNSTATRVNAEGIIEEVQPNVPRVDYSTGEPMLLVEGQATNLHYQQNINNWSINNITVQPSLIKSPTGEIPSELIVIEGGIAANINNNLQVTLGETYTASIYVSRDYKGFVEFYGFGNGGTGVIFDLINLNSTTQSGWLSSKITIINHNWVRLEGTLKPNSHGIFFFGFCNEEGGAVVPSGDKISVCGAQLELGDKATSYIPTTGSVVTRLADNIFQTFPKTGDAVITFSDGTIQTINGIEGETFTLPEGVIKKVEML